MLVTSSLNVISPYQYQALKKISKFVHGHTLPRAVDEIGLLCSVTLYSNPEEASLSPSLEASVVYQLNVISVAINFGGPHILQYKEEIKEAISAAFDAPS